MPRTVEHCTIMEPSRTVHVPPDEHVEADYDALLRELAEAATSFRFDVAPNPCVGAAVLSDGVEIGRGFHEAWGGAHAEIHALAAARRSGVPRGRWDTILITLEPCSSTGKTPPCVDAILAHDFRRVVVGALDPDPRHRGKGLEKLHHAGLEVIVLSEAAPLATASPHFLRWTRPERIRRARPWTIAKWAQTRTGQLRPPKDVGEGRWISGPLSLAAVQVLRGRVDAIITGMGTLLADNPRLTVRSPGDTRATPIRVVLDSTLSTPPGARLFQPPGEAESGGGVHIFTRRGPDPGRLRLLEEVGAHVHPVQTGDDGRPSLRAVQTWMWETGVRRALLEAGPTLLDAWFEAELVDQIAVYTGSINGGRGPSMGHRLRPEGLRQIRHLEVGDDALLDAFLP